MQSSIKLRLTVMNFLQFAVWGAYLTSMGRYLGTAGFGSEIGNFYAMQGLVSLFMPALMGIVADRWIPAQRLLGGCHMLAGMLMLGVFLYTQTDAPSYPSLFALYSLSVAFYMPTLALSNSVAYTSLDQAGLDLVKSFPPIRVFGTVGFICTMIAVSLLGLEATSGQFAVSAIISLVLAVYAQTLPNCPRLPRGRARASSKPSAYVPSCSSSSVRWRSSSSSRCSSASACRSPMALLIPSSAPSARSLLMLIPSA